MGTPGWAECMLSGDFSWEAGKPTIEVVEQQVKCRHKLECLCLRKRCLGGFEENQQEQHLFFVCFCWGGGVPLKQDRTPISKARNEKFGVLEQSCMAPCLRPQLQQFTAQPASACRTLPQPGAEFCSRVLREGKRGWGSQHTSWFDRQGLRNGRTHLKNHPRFGFL